MMLRLALAIVLSIAAQRVVAETSAAQTAPDSNTGRTETAYPLSILRDCLSNAARDRSALSDCHGRVAGRCLDQVNEAGGNLSNSAIHVCNGREITAWLALWAEDFQQSKRAPTAILKRYADVQTLAATECAKLPDDALMLNISKCFATVYGPFLVDEIRRRVARRASPKGGLPSESPDWRGQRHAYDEEGGVRGFRRGGRRKVLLNEPAKHSEAHIKRKAHCLIRVDGKTYLSHLCIVHITKERHPGSASVDIGTWNAKSGGYFAFIRSPARSGGTGGTWDIDAKAVSQNRKGSGTWSADWNAGESHAHNDLGEFRHVGSCWINKRAKLCAFGVNMRTLLALRAGP
jgi:hypothetical protein